MYNTSTIELKNILYIVTVIGGFCDNTGLIIATENVVKNDDIIPKIIRSFKYAGNKESGLIDDIGTKFGKKN